MARKRATIIVLDSAGIGYLPDAAEFGDVGANTFCNIYKKRGHLDIPNMRSFGIGNIEGAELGGYDGKIIGCYGRAMEKTKAKDTTCGHWEMAGIIMDNPFKTYPNGFPKKIMDKF